jgi:hypothetical protein
LLGLELDGREVASARSAQLDELGENQASALALSILSGGHPSALEPRGASLAVAAASSADLERIRGALIEEPLRVAFLENSGSAQAASAQKALDAWLAPSRTRTTSCFAAERTPPRPGTWTLETASPTEGAARFILVPLQGQRELGQALAWLLNRPGGYLDQALTAPGLVATAQALYLGGSTEGGLLVALSGEPDQLPRAEAQARALLDALARGGLTPADAERAEQARQERELAELSGPRARIVQLWQGRKPVPVTAPALSAFARGLAAARHGVVRLEKRK